MKLMLNDLRSAFADNLYVAGTFPGSEDGTPAHALTVIVPPKHPAVKQLDAGFLKLATADKKWGNGDAAKAQKFIDTCMKDRKKSAWQKVEYTNDEGEVYDGFEDAYYLRGRNETMPLIIDQLRREVGKGAAGAPYGGCFVNVQVELFLQSNSFGKGLRCRLLGVQFVRDGDAFTGGAQRSDVNDFQSLAVDDQEEEEADEFA